VGGLLLVCLYFEIRLAVYFIIAVSALEGVTNWRVPRIINAVRHLPYPPVSDTDNLSPIRVSRRINFEAERAFRLTFSAILALGYLVYPVVLWWLSWFMGFAVFGAGVSGVCPLLFTLKWIGFSDRPQRQEDSEAVS